jgi:hypothetical protein
MKKRFTVLIFLLLYAQTAQAEPSPTTHFLMNEPASLLDLGIYKLEKDIKGLQKDLVVNHTTPFDISVDYNWDENRIAIQMTYGYEGNPPKKIIRIGIKKVFQRLKGFLGVDPQGKVYHKRGFSKVSDYFSHEGYVIKNRPKDLEKEIDQIVELKVIYSVQNFSRLSECKNMLVGRRVSEIVCTN